MLARRVAAIDSFIGPGRGAFDEAFLPPSVEVDMVAPGQKASQGFVESEKPGEPSCREAGWKALRSPPPELGWKTSEATWNHFVAYSPLLA